MNIYELCEMQDLGLIVKYRTRLKDWYCFVERYAVKDDIVLIGVFGEGLTPEAALISYIERIKGKKLIAMYGEHKEFIVPMSLTK